MSNEQDIKQVKERWHFSKTDPKQIQRLSERLNIDPLLATILLARNVGNGDIDELNDFINPPEALLREFKSVSNQKNLNRALDRIEKAIKSKKKILIFFV